MSMIPKRSVKVLRKKTSVTLEDPFWEALNEIAAARGTNRNALINAVARERAHANLSSALRVLVLEHFRSVIAKQEQREG
jgi:predicted DNA-binding ribbon-helix-helix protein